MFAVYVVDVPKTPILENTNVSDKIDNSLVIVSLLFTSTAINTLKYWYVDANCPNQLTYSSHLFYYLMPLKNMAMTFVKYVKVHENFLLNCSWEWPRFQMRGGGSSMTMITTSVIYSHRSIAELACFSESHRHTKLQVLIGICNWFSFVRTLKH